MVQRKRNLPQWENVCQWHGDTTLLGLKPTKKCLYSHKWSLFNKSLLKIHWLNCVRTHGMLYQFYAALCLHNAHIQTAVFTGIQTNVLLCFCVLVCIFFYIKCREIKMIKCCDAWRWLEGRETGRMTRQCSWFTEISSLKCCTPILPRSNHWRLSLLKKMFPL